MEQTSFLQKCPGRIRSLLSGLFRDFRSAKRLFGRVKTPLLCVILLYKTITLVLFMPCIHLVWETSLKLSRIKYVTSDHLPYLFRSPSMLCAIVLIAILTAWWTLFEFSLILNGLDLAKKGERCRLFSLFSRSFLSIRHAVFPANWPILILSGVLVPFTSLFISSDYIRKLQVPEYIMQVIRTTPVFAALYAIVFALSAVTVLCLALTFHFFILEKKSFLQSAACSLSWIRKNTLSSILKLLLWNFRLLLRVSIPLIATVLLYMSGIVFIGLKHTHIMLGLWRSFMFILLPFFFCAAQGITTIGQTSILSVFYYAEKEQQPFVLEKRLPNGRKYRSGGRLLFLSLYLAVFACSGLTAAIAAVIPGTDLSELSDLSLLSIFYPQTSITCHRGYSSAAPENTLPAFDAAADAGADCAELDVQMTKDGVVVLTHDANLKRCTGRNANVYDLTFDEVETLDAGSWFSPEFAGTKIPTLEEVIRHCKGKIRLNIEIKPHATTPGLEAEVARIIQENDFVDECVVTSLSYDSLKKVKAACSRIKTGYILAMGIGSYYDLPDVDFFSMEATFITANVVKQLHSRGKNISAWTIDREEDAERLIQLEVDDLITDDPVMVRMALQSTKNGEQALLEVVKELRQE